MQSAQSWHSLVNWSGDRETAWGFLDEVDKGRSVCVRMGSVWFRKRREDEYVVDTSQLTREHVVDVCRAALELVRPDVDRFQCDVPWDNKRSWPPEVVDAATVLAPLPAGVGPTQTYQSTGWVTGFTDTGWDAFVTFAAYSYAADAWTADMERLIDISDEGTRLGVSMSPDRLAILRRSLKGAEVVPVADWSRRRQEQRGVRQSRRHLSD